MKRLILLLALASYGCSLTINVHPVAACPSPSPSPAGYWIQPQLLDPMPGIVMPMPYQMPDDMLQLPKP